MDKKQTKIIEDADEIMKFCVERMAKYGIEVTMESYPTNDGRMKYEVYVELQEHTVRKG